jgi:excisionase family DNA binding protein
VEATVAEFFDLSVADLSRRLGLSEDRIRRLAASGKLPGVRAGIGGNWRFCRRATPAGTITKGGPLSFFRRAGQVRRQDRFARTENRPGATIGRPAGIRGRRAARERPGRS